MNKKTILTNKAPAAIGPYVHAIMAGDIIFTSGQLGIEPSTGELAEGIEEQTKLVINNIEAILKEADLELSDVVKTTVFIQDLENFGIVNKIYEEMFKGHKPARSCVQVARLPKDALVEIEVIAARN